MSAEVKFYSPLEEKINVYSHAVGLMLSIVGLMLLTAKGIFAEKGVIYAGSLIVYGISMVVLYAASTFYHREQNPVKRIRLRVFDHAAIFVLIAGTYTPYALLGLKGPTGWWLFGISWAVAFTGIILKIFFTGKYSLASTMMYIAMGWMAVFVIKPLINDLAPQALFWLAAGGLAYTVGAIIYSIKKIPYNHAIFHLFVLAGSACHFVGVYFWL